MADPTAFHSLADRWLQHILDIVEDADTNAVVDADIGESGLTLVFPGGKTYLVTKHAINEELWVASPLCGGVHFQQVAGEWRARNGQELCALLTLEFSALGLPGIAVTPLEV